MDKWTKEFPTEEGVYWFYGYRFGKISCGSQEKPKLMIVKVYKSGQGDMTYVAEGNFMYKSEVEDAHFLKTDIPDLPIIG